ncbi:MAG: hypothetical protein WAW86_03160 [Gammaproteobacteria bacterium]
MNIPQYLSGSYKAGNNVTWQISQCNDEDYTTSKSIDDDKFTINLNGKLYSSSPKVQIEITLDANYGIDCAVEATSATTKQAWTTNHIDHS